MAIGTQVESDQHHPDGGLAKPELPGQRPGRLGGAGGQPSDSKHGPQLGQPVHDVIGVETIRVEGKAGPGPPHAAKQPSEHQHTMKGAVVA